MFLKNFKEINTEKSGSGLFLWKYFDNFFNFFQSHWILEIFLLGNFRQFIFSRKLSS